MDVLRFHSHLLAERQTLFKQGTCRLQLAVFQVDESQQTERLGAVEGAVEFPKVCQALLGQLPGTRPILLRDKEQACLQVAHPAKTHLIIQGLVERETFREQCPCPLVLSLFGGSTRPFGRALALPPAVTQLLKAGDCLLQPCMGQCKLASDARDSTKEP